MHYLIVLNWLSLGGAERQALLFARELKARGHQVTVVGLSTPGVVQDMCKDLGIPCHYWPFDFSPSLTQKLHDIWTLYRKITALKPDFIIPYDMVPNLLCGLFWRFTGARGFAWQQRDEGRTRRARILERAALAMTPAFISNSQHAVDWLVRELKVDPHKINVIRNGVVMPDASTLESGRWKSRHGLPNSTRIVSMVANIHFYKDHQTLVQAWKIVLDEHPNPDTLMLVLAGNHQAAWPEIEEYLISENIRDRVYAPGGINDVPDLLFDTEIVAFSSMNEGVPNGILEGMAQSKPIVGTAIPGIIETGIGHHPKQLSPPQNSQILAQNILWMLQNPDQATQIGQKNKHIIETEFTVEQMVNRTIETVSFGL
jgi:glycosyltransferase involved in cell wall biosynthesis